MVLQERKVGARGVEEFRKGARKPYSPDTKRKREAREKKGFDRSRKAGERMRPSPATRAASADAVGRACVRSDVVERRVVMRVVAAVMRCVVVCVVMRVIMRVACAVMAVARRAHLVMWVVSVVWVRREVGLGRVLVRRRVVDPMSHATAAAAVHRCTAARSMRDVERVRTARTRSVCIPVRARDSVEEMVIPRSIVVRRMRLVRRPPAPTGTRIRATDTFTLARLFALGRSSTGQPAAGHTLVARHNVDQKVEQIRPTNGTGNIGPLDRPALVLFRNQERAARQIGDKDLARPGKEDRRLGGNHLDLVVRLHHLLDSRQRKLPLGGQTRLEVDHVAVRISALFDKVHLVSPEGRLKVIEVL